MGQPLHILLAEDNANDAELLLGELRRAGFDPVWERVDTEEAYAGGLAANLDLIISDYDMPQFNGLQALEMLKASGLDIPFLIVSGTIGEDTAVAAMKLGAADYLLKDRLARLGPAVRQALEQNRLRHERNQADAQRRKAEARLNQLVSRSPTVIYSLKMSGEVGQLNYVSANISELTGFTVEESLRPEQWREQLHPDDRDAAMVCLRLTLELGSNRAEYRIKRKNGTYIWVEDRKRMLSDSGNETPEIVGGWTDITLRKQAEEKLRINEERFRRLIENASDIIALIDEKGLIRYQSPSVPRVLGYSVAEMMGQRIAEFIHPEDLAKAGAFIQQALADQDKPTSVELRIRHRDGKWRILQSLGKRMAGTAGDKLIVVNSRDITESRLLEEKFLRAQRMEAIGTLASGVAHDLNNILTPMLMVAGLLKETLTDQHDRDMLTLVEGSARRGASIISQLLTFSRGTEGARGCIQLRHLLRETANIIQETFPRNIELKQNLPDDLWGVVVDATQLHQVLLNLCVNARDAMVDGGQLTLTAQNVRLTEKDVQAHSDVPAGPHVQLTVSDTGCGIPAAIIDRVFDPFFTTKEVGKGTGLGLSTVIGIVKSHKGFVKVDSTLGRGTSFSVFLPAIEVAKAEPVALAVPRSAGNGELVLLVDDEPGIMETLRELLENHHYRVIVASNGEDAIRIFIEYSEAVQVVITDMMMPVMGGLALINTLRVLKPAVKFIATTGLGHERDTAELIRLGVTKILTKPFSTDELLGAINLSLEK